MPPVNDRTLNWLYSVLTNEYTDVNRTYNDAAEALAQYPSLSPRTDVYTYENGVPALLLLLSGTLPVQFRGAIYRFPIAVWVPHDYPREPPMVYVTPTQDMLVRPGQHVSGEGRVYHPYLSGWASYWDKSSVSDFLTVLRGVFAKEPPVVAKQDQFGSPQPTASPAPPPVPPPPEEWRKQTQPPPTASPAPTADQAPPPPPKPPKDTGVNGSPHPNGYGQQYQQQGPPRPPIPPGMGQAGGRPDYGRPAPHGIPPQRQASLTDRPLPPTPQDSAALPPRPPFQTQPYGRDSPVSPITPGGMPGPPPSRYSQPPPLPPQQQQQAPGYQAPGLPQYASPPPNQYPQSTYPPPAPQYQQYPQQQPPYMPTPPAGPQFAQPPPQPPQPKPPVPDLLTSELDVQLPSQTSSDIPLPVPPVPPNPQKDALLSALSSALVAQTTQTVQGNTAAVPALRAQGAALRAAHAHLQQELEQLQRLDAALASNERVLADAMREADRAMDDVRTRTVPDVDDTLVAPTVVGGQLWGLVAEERGLEEAIFLLGRGLDRGRVGAEVFVKQTRGLAREQFLKKALIKKISKGMGLDENVEYGLRSGY